MKRLCENTLEPLRETLQLPVVITSGFRTKTLNDILAHASERSQHMAGQAADFYVGEGADVTIVAGCGVHTSDGHDVRHHGIHRFILAKGARVLRVHDVADAVAAVRVMEALRQYDPATGLEEQK